MRVFLLLLWGLCAVAQELVFEHANVVPMSRDTVLKDHSVHVKDGRFVDMGPSGRFKFPAGATRIDAKGKFLAPGFAEMHGHIPPPNAPAGFIEDVLFLYVANGVTTVRGMLGYPGQLELREKSKRNEIVAPALYLAGPSFSGATVKSEEQAVARVRQQKSEGWDLLKIHPGLTKAQYDAMAKTAREVGIRFSGHVPADVGILHALEAGQETIDHLDGYIEYLDSLGSPVSDARMIEVAKKTKQAGAAVVPTMVLWETIIGAPDAATVNAFPELKYMPRAQVTQWKEAFQFRQSNANFSLEKVRRVAQDRKRLLKILHEQGVEILFGTDAPQQFSVPGFSAHREMRFMESAGMKPYEVIRSGTANVGRYFKAKHAFGTIEKGQRADAVLLDGNPLESAANYSKIAGVLLRGRWMPASEIQAGLDRIAARQAQ
jgi:imidazolonepropionase-like amidohydrolase